MWQPRDRQTSPFLNIVVLFSHWRHVIMAQHHIDKPTYTTTPHTSQENGLILFRHTSYKYASRTNTPTFTFKYVFCVCGSSHGVLEMEARYEYTRVCVWLVIDRQQTVVASFEYFLKQLFAIKDLNQRKRKSSIAVCEHILYCVRQL